MPLAIPKLNADVLSNSKIKEFGFLVRPVIARYCSIDGVLLAETAIDWDVRENHPGSIMPDFCLDIHTYDYEARIQKLTEEEMLALKAEIIAVAAQVGLTLPSDEKWLWMRYVNQLGFHV